MFRRIVKRWKRALGRAPDAKALMEDSEESQLVDVDSDSDSLDDSSWGTHEVDPADADIYQDALWAPMFYRLERVEKDKESTPRCSDYTMVSLFLLLNVALQLAIAFKIDQVALNTYGEIGQALFGGACWRAGSRPELFSVLYPPDVEISGFDCVYPLLTLSMFPQKLDLDKNGYWSVGEAEEVSDRLRDLGSAMASNFSSNLLRMAKYDFNHRPGSRSDPKHFRHLDMDFFRHYRGRIKMCLPTDPNICGNLAAHGKLRDMLPDVDDADERVRECIGNFEHFCLPLYGSDYRWIHYTTSKLCGDPSFELRDGVNVVTYDAVSIYKGEPDSILGRTFVSFLVLLLFIWGMLMVSEFRSCYNFLLVVWHTPSTRSGLRVHRKPWEDGGEVAAQKPQGLCDGLRRISQACDSRGDPGCWGQLSHSDQQLARLGLEQHSTWQPLVLLAIVLTATAGWTSYAYFSRHGLAAIGAGMECLCHFEGDCSAAGLL
ncbi:unnamed protein product [Durusdinium trenchii]|uniref:Uncharacterized protein n=1 Tax=Durusdinium trenchii TaxID=1381693 RepID=A0ABP0L718_9DINO